MRRLWSDDHLLNAEEASGLEADSQMMHGNEILFFSFGCLKYGVWVCLVYRVGLP